MQTLKTEKMRNEILNHLDDAEVLEQMYHTDKALFSDAFQGVYPIIRTQPIARFWYERLRYKQQSGWRDTARFWFTTLIIAVIAGCIAKLPALFSLDEELFYSKNTGFVLFPALAAYFSWKHRLSIGNVLLLALTMLLLAVFINSLPDHRNSDSIALSCMHLMAVLWSLTGFAFIKGDYKDHGKRLDYLKYNGDLIVITGLILMGGAILSGMTIGLFELIGLKIAEFYFQNIVIFLLPAAPILGTYLIDTNPDLVGRVSPVIARIFSPLVLIMLSVYLVVMVYSGKDPYSDREFLVIFNVLLGAVMAIIFFSISGSSQTTKGQAEIWVLFLLSLVTVTINIIALSAIVFRISEWGLTPNRTAVLGGNLLALINLVFVTIRLYQSTQQKEKIVLVGKAIAAYLPVYWLWAIIVTFTFPFLFSYQ